jgi:N utilization substance protein B
MTRRELRENTFKILFRLEFHDRSEMAEQIDWYMEELFELPEEEAAYLRSKCSDIVAHVQELDDAISEKATGWKPSRMGKVDLTLLRLAVYEIRYEEAIPFKVAVNEAVELAKRYGTDDSPSFVNGVLAKFAEHDE